MQHFQQQVFYRNWTLPAPDKSSYFIHGVKKNNHLKYWSVKFYSWNFSKIPAFACDLQWTFLYFLEPQCFMSSPFWMKMAKWGLCLPKIIQIFSEYRFPFTVWEVKEGGYVLFCHNCEKAPKFKDLYLHNKPNLKLWLKKRMSIVHIRVKLKRGIKSKTNF